MVRGCGSALLNQELRSALWSLLAIPLRAFHIRRVGRFMEDLRVMALQKHRGGTDSSVWAGWCSAHRHLVVVCLCMLPVVSSTRQEPGPPNVHMFM